MRYLSILSMLLLFAGISLTKDVSAQTPQFAYTGPGATASNAIPLGTGTSWDDYRSQWIYLPGDLGSTIYPGLITTIYFRVGSASSTASHVYNNFEVNMGQSSVTNLNTAYQTGLTNVYPAGSFTVAGPLIVDQWIPITLATPYFYDPANTLIVEIKHGTKTSGGFSLRSGGSSLNPAYSSSHTQRYGKITTSPNGTSRTYTYQFGVDIIPADRPDNAGLGNLVAPLTFCDATQNIQVELKNNGTNLINNVEIHWELDGVAQTPYVYSGTPIPSLLGPGSNTLTATIGTGITFSNTPRTVKAWTTLPNGNADTVNTDDTMTYVIQKSLSGDYYVGGTNPDFTDVKEAVDALKRAGVCAPVNFIIRSGTYTDAGVINGPIAGSTTVNRVTFMSETGNATDVVINGFGGANVFGLDNVSNVTIKNMTLLPVGTTAITIGGTTSNDTIMNCILRGPTSTSTTVAQALISCVSSSNYAGNNNVFFKNTFENSTTGLYLYASSAKHGLDNIIDSNTFLGQNYTSAYLYYLDGTKLRGNTAQVTSNTYGYGMYAYRQGNNGSNIVEITGNDINITTGSSYAYAAYFAYIIADGDANRSIIAHNKITTNAGTYFYNHLAYYSEYADIFDNEIISSGTYGSAYFYYSDFCNYYNNSISLTTTDATSTTYGMYHYNNNGSKFYNNTISVNSPSASSYGCYFYSSSNTYNNNYIRNNVFANYGAGIGMYWSSTGNANTSDYNNIYAASKNFFSNAGTADTSLHNWRATKAQEKNSICYDPGLVGGGDNHPDPSKDATWSLNGRGLHIAGNNVDRDGNARETDRALGVPDIGAYEFTPTTIPPLAIAANDMAPGVTQAYTFGQDTVVTLDWAPNSVVSNTIEVRAYSGVKGPSYPTGINNMYFYADVITQNVTTDYTAKLYYKDIWLGNIGNESDLRLFKKLDPDPWIAYNENLSNVDVNRNVISATDLTSTGLLTGVENNAVFSAIIVPMGQTTFCPGASVDLHAKTTSPTYTYQWYLNGSAIPGATDTSYTATIDGDYEVVITKPSTGSGISATSNIVAVTKIPAPTAQVNADGPMVFCTGGQRVLFANSGAGLKYQWQLDAIDIPGATNDTLSITSAGNYSVTVSNIGCATTSPVSVITTGPLTVDIGKDTSFCESIPLVLNAGYPGAKYLWSTGDTTQTITVYDQPGNYSVFVDAGTNCVDRDTVSVLIDPLPSVVGISYIRQQNNTFNFSASGAQDVNTYTWIFGDGTVDFSLTPSHTYTDTEPWEVTLIVTNDCGNDTTFLDIRSLSVAGVKGVSEMFNLYPNPATERITLSGTEVIANLLIVNNVGQVVRKMASIDNKSIDVDVSKLPAGYYILHAKTKSGEAIVKPFNIVK